MENIEVIFKQDIVEKAKTARGSRCRASRKKGYKGNVKTPMDFMSRKEINKLNGKVVVYNMYDTVMEYEQFKALPESERKATLAGYLKRHSRKAIAEVEGWNLQKVHDNARKLGLSETRTPKTENVREEVTMSNEGKVAPDYEGMLKQARAENDKLRAELHKATVRSGFTMELDEEMTGDELATRLLKMGDMLFKDKGYIVHMTVKEKRAE